MHFFDKLLFGGFATMGQMFIQLLIAPFTPQIKGIRLDCSIAAEDVSAVAGVSVPSRRVTSRKDIMTGKIRML
jgi:hypothetical protein